MVLQNVRCLISAGPTREYFDPVRFLSNPSSGKMGYALAEAALEAGWMVDLVSGPTALPEPENPNLTFYPVETGEEMLHQIDGLFDPCDILIMTAAVMDYRPTEYSAKKVKKGAERLTVTLEPTTDILATLTARKGRQFVVGFAAETDSVEEYARDKMRRKQCDMMVANRVGGASGGFQSDDNEVLLLDPDGFRESIGPGSKAAIARHLIRCFATRMGQRKR